MWFAPYTSNIVDSNEIRFSIPPLDADYMILHETRLHIKGKYVKVANDGSTSNTAAGDEIAPVNLLPLALFSKCSVRANNNEVCTMIDRELPYKGK